jgi:hypothetical protein
MFEMRRRPFFTGVLLRALFAARRAAPSAASRSADVAAGSGTAVSAACSSWATLSTKPGPRTIW